MTKRSPPDAFSGVQGESGVGRNQGRELSRRAGAAVRRPSEPDHHVEGQLLEGAAGVFGGDKSEAKEAAVDLKALHAKIGQLTLESDFLEGAVRRRDC